MAVTFATLTHTGLVRRTNEDSYFARPPVFVVADGMGGAQAGEVASAMAARAFEYFLPQSDRPEEELARVIARANAAIYDYATGDSGHAGMGTTATAAAVRGGTVYIAHVGDSRAWLLRDGSLRRLTEDHSLVAEMIREGQITEEEASDHPQRSIITRALGVDPTVEVDTSSVAWQPGDVFLLASDGLHSMVPEKNIEEIVAGGGDLDGIARSLVEAANAAGGSDNVTVVLFSPDGSLPGRAAEGEQTAVFAAGAISPEAVPAADPANSAAETSQAAPAALPATRGGRLKTWFSTLPGLVTLGVLLAVIVLGGAWFVTRNIYYVGVEGDKVSIYQGIPYSLGPLPLSSLYRSSPVNFKDMEPYERERVAAQDLQSKGGAEQMLTNLIQTDQERKDEQQRLLMEEEQKQKTQQQTLTVPPEGLP